MGAWGIGGFENDDALDWVADLEADGVTAIREAIDLTAADAYLDVDVGARVIAAAEVVAAARDGDASTLPDDVREWLESNAGTITEDDAGACVVAIQRVLRESSELPELWKESDDGAAWLEEVESLLARFAPRA